MGPFYTSQAHYTGLSEKGMKDHAPASSGCLRHMLTVHVSTGGAEGGGYCGAGQG